MKMKSEARFEERNVLAVVTFGADVTMRSKGRVVLAVVV